MSGQLYWIHSPRFACSQNLRGVSLLRCTTACLTSPLSSGAIRRLVNATGQYSGGMHSINLSWPWCFLFVCFSIFVQCGYRPKQSKQSTHQRQLWTNRRSPENPRGIKRVFTGVIPLKRANGSVVVTGSNSGLTRRECVWRTESSVFVKGSWGSNGLCMRVRPEETIFNRVESQ